MYWISSCFGPFPLNYDHKPRGTGSVNGDVARENFHAFLPKMTILLILNTDTHFVKKFSYSISLMTKIIHFLMYWTLLHSIKIRIPWDIILIRQALPENHAFCLGPIAKYIHFR